MDGGAVKIVPLDAQSLTSTAKVLTGLGRKLIGKGQVSKTPDKPDLQSEQLGTGHPPVKTTICGASWRLATKVDGQKIVLHFSRFFFAVYVVCVLSMKLRLQDQQWTMPMWWPRSSVYVRLPEIELDLKFAETGLVLLLESKQLLTP